MLQKLYLFVMITIASLSQTSIAHAESSPVQVKIIQEEQAIQPGHPFWVAVHFQVQDNWHTYWKNPGDAGMPMNIEWHLPEGFTASAITWPVPEKFSIDSMVGYGYEGEFILLSQITPPDSLTVDNPVQIKADVSWLVCSDSQCVPGSEEITADLAVKKDSAGLNTESAHLFTKARNRLPRKSEGIQATRKQDGIEVQVSLPKDHDHTKAIVQFYPEEKQVIDSTIEAIWIPSSDSHGIVKLKETSSSKEARTENLKGILIVAHHDETVSPHMLDINTPILDTSIIADASGEMVAKSPLPPAPIEFEGGLAMALVLAFVGGMILNLMPCVLPVVSFKILSFVKMSGQSRMTTIKHGVAFFFGVLVSFWILAGMLLILQSYGESVGWGFQLQEPLFVGFLAALLFVFGLSLFGVFEFGAGLTSWAGNAEHRMKKKEEGLLGSFSSGVLATVVATPCTGPMLGTVIGFAATLSPFASMLIFTVLGTGMAAPYLLIAFFPNLMRFLPKPGSWMDTFRELMGFMMLATVLWLIWVFSAQTESNGLVLLIGGLFFLSLGCWIYGKWGSPVKDAITRIVGIILALGCFVTGGYVITIASKVSAIDMHEGHSFAGGDHIAMADKSGKKISRWEKYSPERVKELQRQGTPVFVDFTAKWCLICQANHLAYSTSEVEEKFADLGVVKMKADWTRNDPIITEELRKHGRNGVPLYLLFEGDETKAPQILPQVLTPAIMLEYLASIEK